MTVHPKNQWKMNSNIIYYLVPNLNDLLFVLHFWGNCPFNTLSTNSFWVFCDETLVIDLIQIFKQDASRIWTLKCYFTLTVGKKVSVHNKDAARRSSALVTIFVEGQNEWGEDENKYYTTITNIPIRTGFDFSEDPSVFQRTVGNLLHNLLWDCVRKTDVFNSDEIKIIN